MDSTQQLLYIRSLWF